MTELLSTVTMTMTPPDEGSLIEVTITAPLHPALLVNAVAVAADAAIRATHPPVPGQSPSLTDPLVIGVDESGQPVIHNPETLDGRGCVLLAQGMEWKPVRINADEAS
jgi:hypothetical protein